MNEKQMQAAQQAMVEWLCDPRELGKPPAKIACAGTLTLDEKTYYLFQFKKGLLGKWLLGVCGGYEGDSTENCGHVFSQMAPFDPATAAQQATEMVEFLRDYLEKQNKDPAEEAGHFLGFALLGKAGWDKRRLIADLQAEWGIAVKEEGEDNSDDILYCAIDNMNVAVSLMPAPVPNREAEQSATGNYLWPDAVKTAKAHKAHLLVAVLGQEPDPRARGVLFAKVMACCCKQPDVTGIYTSGTVFEPQFYAELADVMKQGELPIFNWVWLGLYRTEKGCCCYTCGMETLGKHEMEVLDAEAQPSEVREFMGDLVMYVLQSDVTLQDGETIGFSAEEKHAITLSPGVSMPGTTLKIAYTAQ